MTMRAKQVIEERSEEARKEMSRLLKASAPTTEALLAAMRQTSLHSTVLRHCQSPLMREDLALLAANPFDVVRFDELVEPDIFEAIGLIHPVSEDECAVNLDMALTLVARTPIEFGFAATLLARLSNEDLQLVAKAAEIGPRPSHTDFLIDIAEAMIDSERIARHVAHLRERDRSGIVEAVAAGELPDDIDEMGPDVAPPLVTLDPGEAGKRGILFWFTHSDRNIDTRPVVVLELQDQVEAILEQVPPPPEVTATKKRTRRTTTARPRRTSSKSQSSTTESRAPSGNTPTMARTTEEMQNPFADSPAIPISAFSAVNASGVVDLEVPRLAELAMKDPELSESVLDIVAENLVVLRAGVDVQEWVERAVLRLN